MSTLHRISAGALVIHENRILLVKHGMPGHDDFWVPPGGGVEGKETLFDCAVRECFEETGLRIRPQRIVYVEELFDEGRRICKHWILCDPIDRNLNLNITNAFADENLLDARFVSPADITSLNVFPRLMRGQFWDDLAAGFPSLRYIGFEG